MIKKYYLFVVITILLACFAQAQTVTITVTDTVELSDSGISLEIQSPVPGGYLVPNENFQKLTYYSVTEHPGIPTNSGIVEVPKGCSYRCHYFGNSEYIFTKRSYYDNGGTKRHYFSAFKFNSSTQLELVSEIEIGANSGFIDMAIYENYLIAATGWMDILVYDITDVYHMKEVARITDVSPSTSWDMYIGGIIGDYLYYGGSYDEFDSGFIRSIDISNMSDPKYYDEFSLNDELRDMRVVDDNVLVGGNFNGWLLDTDDGNMTQHTKYTDPVLGVGGYDKYGIFGSETGLILVDLSTGDDIGLYDEPLMKSLTKIIFRPYSTDTAYLYTGSRLKMNTYKITGLDLPEISSTTSTTTTSTSDTNSGLEDTSTEESISLPLISLTSLLLIPRITSRKRSKST